jgi:hypothetical protein
VLRVVFEEMVHFITYGLQPPYRYKDKSTFVGMSMAAMALFQQQLSRYAEEDYVVLLGLPCMFLRAVQPILMDRYACPFELWQHATQHSVSVIDLGLRGLAANEGTPSAVAGACC